MPRPCSSLHSAVYQYLSRFVTNTSAQMATSTPSDHLESFNRLHFADSPFLLATLGLGVVLVLWYRVKSLRQKIHEARSTGLPYRVLPFHMLSVPWALSRRCLLPLLDCLPETWTEGWLPFVNPPLTYGIIAKMVFLDFSFSNGDGSMAMDRFEKWEVIHSWLFRQL